MKSLYLLRHAKAERHPGMEDFDRPLARRGRDDARALGAYMRRHELHPALIVCSSARRASETAALVIEGLGPVPTRHHRSLYLASAGVLLREIHHTDEGLASLMLVGHDPGMHALAVALAGNGEPELLASLHAKLPTGALVVLEFEAARWRDVAEGAGRLSTFVGPRDVD
jgi:phosphohistidine phosphatase